MARSTFLSKESVCQSPLPPLALKTLLVVVIFLCCLASLFTLAMATPVVVINEVDCDTEGTDKLEFVELYDGGAGNTDLTGLVVVFYNGNGYVSYKAFDLDGYSTDVDGYFLLGNSGVSPTPGIIFDDNGLQNGADAVALYTGDATEFVSTDNLLDAIVYDTNDADDAGLLILLNEEQPQVNEDGKDDMVYHSNQRCPNGSGGARNTDTYTQATPTPGAVNNCSTPEPVAPGSVVINELAWMGTQVDSNDEWIELYNTTDTPINLNGCRLVGAHDLYPNCREPDITLFGSIPAKGFFLLERTHDTTVSDIPADQIYTGYLVDLPSGSPQSFRLYLKDPLGNVIDTANGNGGGWPAGETSPSKYTMERIDPFAPDSDANWDSNDGIKRNGHDAGGAPINGTPRAPNSTTPRADAGPDQIVDVGDTVQLDGSGSSDASGNPVWSDSHGLWEFVSTPPGSTPALSAPNIVNPTFIADLAGEYVLKLTITSTYGEFGSNVDLVAIRTPRVVVINEIAWMGTQYTPATASAQDEWFELYNTTDQAIDLSHWLVKAADGTPVLRFGYWRGPKNVIPARGFFLVERTDDTTISDIIADCFYTGPLENGGETLYLEDPSGNFIDTANIDGGGWPAGANPLGDTPPGDPAGRATMERIDPFAPDSDDNWATNDGIHRNGHDAKGNPINGTPKERNSGTSPPIAVFTYVPDHPTTWDAIQFTDQSSDSDGTIVSWSWNFGDGGSSNEQNPTNRYRLPGTYPVALEVTDNDGLTGSTVREVTIVLGPGDVNGDGTIDVIDVRLCLQIATGFLTPTAYQQRAADVDEDGDVDLDDAQILAEYIIGIRTELPGGG